VISEGYVPAGPPRNCSFNVFSATFVSGFFGVGSGTVFPREILSENFDFTTQILCQPHTLEQNHKVMTIPVPGAG
jgi:hypothetical protein